MTTSHRERTFKLEENLPRDQGPGGSSSTTFFGGMVDRAVMNDDGMDSFAAA